MRLLRIENLRVTFATQTGPVEAVRDVSFSLGRERRIRPPGRIAAGQMAFDGIDPLRASEKQMRALRGRRLAMVMQDPK